MIKAVRLSKIKEIMLERGHVDVTALSSLLNVSEVTIRSDLEQLEQENFLQRTHGGAVIREEVNQSGPESFCLSEADISHISDKKYIAGIAADLVKPGSWVFIGPGTTCYYIGCALTKKQNVHIVTNNLFVPFRQGGMNQVLITGGNLNQERMSLEGDLFFRSLENLHFSYAFFSVSGISLENGMTVNGSDDIMMINRLREISSRLIVAADHSKFDQTDFMRVGDIDMPDTIITNQNIDDKYKSYCYDHNIQLFTSYRLPYTAVAGEMIP